MLRIAIVALLLLSSAGVRAGEEVVGDCSNDTELRTKVAAIQGSNGGTLTFECGSEPVTIILTADLGIGVPTVIDGGGTITLSGGNARQIISVGFGAQLTLRRIVLTNGFRNFGNGGAVHNGGTLILEDVQILRSSAATWSGGAIWSSALSRLEVRNSKFVDNDAANAGAIFADDGAQVTIVDSVFEANEATVGGNLTGWAGAILLWERAQVTIEGGEFRNNVAFTGGAIATFFPTASLSIRGTAMRDNRAGSRGGGLHLGASGVGSRALVELIGVTLSGNSAERGGGISCISDDVTMPSTVTLRDSTLSANSATRFGGAISGLSCRASLVGVTLAGNGASDGGGGLDLFTGEAGLINVTVSGNRAARGAAILLDSASSQLFNVTIAENENSSSGSSLTVEGGTITMRNTAVANSFGGNCLFAKTNLSQTFNLSSDFSCGFGGAADAADLLLGPLADNGGPTRTHLPQAGSAAIDGGRTTDCPVLDQRGAPRPFGASCDVGAVEVGAAPPSTTTSTTVATSIPTTTTLPGGGGTCAPACETTDPCRPQACVNGSCVSQLPDGLATASCACQRAVPAACAGATIPGKIAKAKAKACALLDAATSATGDRQLRKLGKASRKWTAASKLLFKKPARRALSEACVTALEAEYDDAGSRVDLLVDAVEAGS